MIDRFISWLYTYRLFGPRCADVGEYCPICNAWKVHDQMFNDGPFP